MVNGENKTIGLRESWSVEEAKEKNKEKKISEIELKPFTWKIKLNSESG